MRERPKCERCGGSLDVVPDSDEPGQWTLECNTIRTAGGVVTKPTWSQTDGDFWSAWDSLPGDEVVRLEKQVGW